MKCPDQHQPSRLGLRLAGWRRATRRLSLTATLAASVFGFLLGLIPAQAAPPRIDAILSPTPGATNVSVPPTLAVTVSDPDTSKLSVTFYGRLALTSAAGSNFTVVVLPSFVTMVPRLYVTTPIDLLSVITPVNAFVVTVP